MATPLPKMMQLTLQFPKGGAAATGAAQPASVSPSSADSPFAFSGDFAGASSSGTSLPHNPLAGLVHTNLQQWMQEEEENADEEEEGEEEGEEEDDEGDADGTEEQKQSEGAAAAPATSATAVAPAAGQDAPSSTTLSSRPSSTRKRPRQKRAAELLADDSAELGEILGSGYGQATNSRGAMKVLRRGTRAGKLSKLTPDLEKKMGDANSAYINQEFGKAVDILLRIIQAAPHAEGPYHTLGLIYEERNDISKAIEAYLLAAHMSKHDWGLWKRVGKMASESGELHHAIYCWTRVIGSDSGNDELRWDRAMAYFELKDFRHALDGFQYLLKKFPFNAEYLRQAASCFSHLKKPQSGVTLILGYIEWFKDTVKENEAAAATAASSVGPPSKKQKTTAAAGADGSASVDYSHIRSCDLDIDLVNIMCELLLALHKYQDVVDAHEDLEPYLLASAQRLMPQPDGVPVELPFDLLSKLGIALLYLKEYSQAETIFAPILDTRPNVASKYDVDSWGDLYIDVAEAYVNNKMYPQAEKLLAQVVDAPAWAHMRNKVFFLQARCAHYQAVASIQSAWANPAHSSEAPHTDLLRQALRLYECVHTEEDGTNVDARLAMSEILQILGEKEKAMEILKGVDIESHPAAFADISSDEAKAATGDETGPASAAAKVRSSLPASASSLKHLDDMRIFHQTCELHLGSGHIDDFLAVALPVLVNVSHASCIGVEEEEDEPMPHAMHQPSVAPGMDAVSRGLPAFPLLPLDKSSTFTAQRSMLTVEFLRPACAAIKHLYARGRLAESLWLIHHLDRMLQRYVHTSQSSSVPVTSISQPGSTAHSTGVITAAMSFSEQVRLIMLGLKYVSAGIFLRLGDAERAYHAIRGPMQHLPYSFPLAHTMNVILNHQSYPGKAIRTLERLLLKHPDSMPIRMLLGHGCLVHQNYECALQHYLHLHAHAPRHALVLLLIGITKLQISLKKLNQYRHHDLTVAFAFLYQYVETKKAESDTQPFATQEAYYNLARACQYVGLAYLAIPYYQKVLSLSADATVRVTQKVRRQPDAYQREPPTPLSSLHAEAAHNLACVYAQTGSPELARRVYAQYCRV